MPLTQLLRGLESRRLVSEYAGVGPKRGDFASAAINMPDSKRQAGWRSSPVSGRSSGVSCLPIAPSLATQQE